MTELIVIQEPIACPICNLANRTGFLLKVFDEETARFIIAGRQIEYKCGTCGALFGVEKNEL